MVENNDLKLHNIYGKKISMDMVYKSRRFLCVWRSLDKISNEGIFVKLMSELIDLIDCLDHITKVRHECVLFLSLSRTRF